MIPWGDDRLCAYADGGRVTYSVGRAGMRIGQLKAFFLGMPSRWSGWSLMLAMVLVPVACFWPVVAGTWRRVRHCADGPQATLSLYHRCLCVLLACIFLVGPETFQTLAHADAQYAGLNTDTWGKNGKTVDYLYDANGSVVSKITKQGGETVEAVAYVYNLRGRLWEVTTTPYVGGDAQPNEVVRYFYNSNGIRVKKIDYDEAETTCYLVDAENHTGYAQVLEETVYSGTDVDPLTMEPARRVTYIMGDDLISQTYATWNAIDDEWDNSTPEYFLYDGHGSTRQLADAWGSVAAADNYN